MYDITANLNIDKTMIFLIDEKKSTIIFMY